MKGMILSVSANVHTGSSGPRVTGLLYLQGLNLK